MKSPFTALYARDCNNALSLSLSLLYSSYVLTILVKQAQLLLLVFFFHYELAYIEDYYVLFARSVYIYTAVYRMGRGLLHEHNKVQGIIIRTRERENCITGLLHRGRSQKCA